MKRFRNLKCIEFYNFRAVVQWLMNFRFYIFVFILHLIYVFGFKDVTALTPDEIGVTRYLEKIFFDAKYDVIEIFLPEASYVLYVIYFPYYIMRNFQVSEILAVRLNSLIFLFLIIFLYTKFCDNHNVSNAQSKRLLYIFILVPSTFIWSGAGIKEIFIFFALMLFLLSFIQINKTTGVFVFMMGSLILATMKPYLWLISFTSLIFLFAYSKLERRTGSGLKRNFGWLLLSSSLTFLLLPALGSHVINNASVSLTQLIGSGGFRADELNLNRKLEQNYEIDGGHLQPKGASETSTIAIGTTTSAYLLEELNKEPLYKKLVSLKPIKELLTWKSEIPREGLDFAPASIKKPFSVLIGISRFLFTPFLFSPTSSLFLNYISIELFIFYFFYISFYLNIKRSAKYFGYFEFSSLYFLIFILQFLIFSSLTEINLGTLCRHRSVLFFSIFLFVTSVDLSKKQSSQKVGQS